MKNKETIEEAAENNYPEGDVWTIEQALIRRLAFINGAKWQAERMYSEEDMKKCWDACLDFNKAAGFDNGISFNEFLKDLKRNKK
jgi:hypothetical protein